MQHQGTKKLETDRLLLRRMVTEDAEEMYHNWACEDAVTKFLTWPTHPQCRRYQAGHWRLDRQL